MDEITTITDEHIESYQKIYKKLYGKEISKQEALEQGLMLVNFVKLLIENDMQNRK
jgi:hypothetical protein